MRFLLATLLAFSFCELVNASPAKKKLLTNVDFNDQVVRGKYQYPDEAVTTVEDEKLLNDLLEVRKDFKDRLKQSSRRH